MNSYPILFSTPMVQAIMRGDKTQTRRIVKPQPDPEGDGASFMLRPPLDWEQVYKEVWKPWKWDTEEGETIAKFCPYGEVGDHLWVRETFWKHETGIYFYKADSEAIRHDAKWKPSIHMPRNAARLILEVTEPPRIEKLQDISAGDARKEGMGPWLDYDTPTAREQFRELWDEINIDIAPWESNPWVWVITFKKL